jgi:hypothetical protein
MIPYIAVPTTIMNKGNCSGSVSANAIIAMRAELASRYANPLIRIEALLDSLIATQVLVSIVQFSSYSFDLPKLGLRKRVDAI